MCSSYRFSEKLIFHKQNTDHGKAADINIDGFLKQDQSFILPVFTNHDSMDRGVCICLSRVDLRA